MTIAYSAPLELGSDLALRHRYFTPESLQHPAKMHAGLLLWLIERYTLPGQTIIDPMYGIGTTGLAALTQRDVIGFEIEPPYLAEAHRNAARIIEAGGLFAGRISVLAHDARAPWPVPADVVIFSPPYGCHAASNVNTRVGTLPHRIRALEDGLMGDRWRLFLEQQTAGSAGALRFFYGDHAAQIGHFRGARYLEEMRAIYRQAYQALQPGGRMIIIIKDHIRRRVHVRTAEQTAALCESLGFALQERHARQVYPLSLWQRRRKERGEMSIEHEVVLIFERDNGEIAL
jgi:hypothetical protein